jgi:Stc1 domain
VPAAVAAPDLEATIAQALAEHRPELEQLVRERVRLALAELTRELVAAELAARSNGGAKVTAGHISETPSSKRCNACGETLPLDAFYADSRRRDGRRSTCKACVERVRADARQAQQEAQPSPFAGTQSPTSHESTPVSA